MHVTKKLALGVGTLALSLALIGGVAAAAFTPADAQAQDEKGRPPVAKIEEILARLVSEGKLSAEQKDAIIARLKEAAEKVEAKRPAQDAKPAPKRPAQDAKPQPKRDEKKGEPNRPAFHWKAALGDHLKGVAALLGLTDRELAAALREGKSLAEVAAAKGRGRADLISAIVTPANAKVDEALAAKKIDAEQAAKAKAEIAKHVEALIDRKHEAKPAPRRDEKKPEPKRDTTKPAPAAPKQP